MPKSDHRKQTKKSRLPLAISLFFFSAFIFLGFISFKVLTLDKFIYVNRAEAGNAEIIIADSKGGTNYKYLIDKDTVFQSARGYGEYKLSSLWLLGEKEGMRGSLISESIVKNMNLPIYLWKDKKYTNLSFFQKIKAFFIEKKVRQYESNLESNQLSNSVYINFIEPEMNDDNLKIEVQDLTGDIGTIDRISKIIEVSGGKITSNTKGYDENLDCEIYGSPKSAVNLLSNVLRCNTTNDSGSGIVLKLGAKFSERF